MEEIPPPPLPPLVSVTSSAQEDSVEDQCFIFGDDKTCKYVQDTIVEQESKTGPEAFQIAVSQCVPMTAFADTQGKILLKFGQKLNLDAEKVQEAGAI